MEKLETAAQAPRPTPQVHTPRQPTACTRTASYGAYQRVSSTPASYRGRIYKVGRDILWKTGWKPMGNRGTSRKFRGKRMEIHQKSIKISSKLKENQGNLMKNHATWREIAPFGWQWPLEVQGTASAGCFVTVPSVPSIRAASPVVVRSGSGAGSGLFAPPVTYCQGLRARKRLEKRGFQRAFNGF